MAKKKKEKLEEGMILMSPMLAVGGVVGLHNRKPDNFEFKGLPGQFDKTGKKIYDNEGNLIKEETDFIAFYNRKQYPIKGKDLWDAKQKAIAQLKIPKSKQGLLAIKSKKSMDAGDFRFEGKINEDSYHSGAIDDFIKKNEEYADLHGTLPRIKVFGDKGDTKFLNVTYDALRQIAKILKTMKI